MKHLIKPITIIIAITTLFIYFFNRPKDNINNVPVENKAPIENLCLLGSKSITIEDNNGLTVKTTMINKDYITYEVTLYGECIEYGTFEIKDGKRIKTTYRPNNL